MCFGKNMYIYRQLKMSAAMAGQIFFRTCTFTSNNNSTLVFSQSQINHINLKTPCMGLKNDAKSFDRHHLPEKPKRPLTAYFKYLLEKRISVMKENPSLQSKDVIKIVSDQWKALSAEDKGKYEEAALEDKKKYNEEVLNYNAHLTPEQEEILHKIQTKKRQDRKKRKIKKELKTMGKPKRPLTSFGVYVQENVIPGKPLVELIPQLQQKWVQMSEVDKQKYQISYQKNKEKYEVELAKWETDMISQGKHHLVRAKTLRKKKSLAKEKLKKEKSK